MDHAAGAEEEQRFEERVRHQVIDAGGKRAAAHADEHVAELRNRGIGEDLLDIVLRQADGGGEESRGDADDGDGVHGGGRVRVDGPRPRGHVDARRDHGGGVDQGGNGRGAGHGVGQPDVSGSCADLPQAPTISSRPISGEHGFGLAGGVLEHRAEIERSEVLDDVEHRQRESEIADAVHDERLVAGVGGELLIEVEADQQIAAQSHAFPADEQHQVIGRQHQRQHEEHEEVQVGEEAVIAAFMRHVADGVNVDERADAGDHQQHDGGELVHGEIAVHAEARRS